ncbi:ribonuclease H-like domain-containing protein [Tanacetum coccineum]
MVRFVNQLVVTNDENIVGLYALRPNTLDAHTGNNNANVIQHSPVSQASSNASLTASRIASPPAYYTSVGPRYYPTIAPQVSPLTYNAPPPGFGYLPATQTGWLLMSARVVQHDSSTLQQGLVQYASPAQHGQSGSTAAALGSTGPTVTPGHETVLPHAFTAGTLHDITTGAWRMEHGYSEYTWHQRLGHPESESEVLCRLVSPNLISCNKEKPPVLCHAYQLGKHVRLPFVSSNTSVTSRFDIVHSDVNFVLNFRDLKKIGGEIFNAEMKCGAHDVQVRHT